MWLHNQKVSVAWLIFQSWDWISSSKSAPVIRYVIEQNVLIRYPYFLPQKKKTFIFYGLKLLSQKNSQMEPYLTTQRTDSAVDSTFKL